MIAMLSIAGILYVTLPIIASVKSATSWINSYSITFYFINLSKYTFSIKNIDFLI